MVLIKRKKGQITLIGILLSFVSIVIYVALLPAITECITEAVPYVSGMTLFLIQLLPLFLILAIIIGIFTYARPIYEN